MGEAVWRRKSWPRVAILVVAGLLVSSEGFLVGWRRPDCTTRLEARKRSRVNAGEEEFRYYHQAEELMAREMEASASCSPTTEMEAALPVGGSVRGGSADRRADYNRDRRVMKMGEDERAYYDRLNAYKGDRPQALDSPPKAVVNVPKEKVMTAASVRFSSSAVRPAAPAAAAPAPPQASGEAPVIRERLDDDTLKGTLLGSRILQETSVPIGRYAAEMSRWNQEGKPSVVLALWDKLRADGIRPNGAIYGQTLRACYTAGDHATAVAAIDDLKKDSMASLDLYSSGLDWAVRLLSHSRRYIQALELLETLWSKGAQLRASSFNIMMAELADMKKWREVIKIMALMKVYKISPNTESYSWAITAHVAIGDMHEATRLLTEMCDQGLAPSEQLISRWSHLAGLQGDQKALWGLQA